MRAAKLQILILRYMSLAILLSPMAACSGPATTEPITASPSGNAVIKVVRDATHVQLQVWEGGKSFTCDVPDEAKAELADWLATAKKDRDPAKYMEFGTLSIESNSRQEWSIYEHGRELVFKAEHTYWRGLDRQEFERILKKCRDAAPPVTEAGKTAPTDN